MQLPGSQKAIADNTRPLSRKTSFQLKKTPFKLILSIILFVVFVSLITCFIYVPYARPFAVSNPYTMVFLGASVFTRGIDPEIIDEQTGETSYVLASRGAPLSGRYEMLKAALKNRNLETVVIEVSYYTLIKQIYEYSLEERLLYFPKVMGVSDKLRAAVSGFSFWEDEYDKAYGQMLMEGFQVWQQDICTAQYQTYVNRRGFEPYRARDQHLETAEEIRDAYGSRELDLRFSEDVIAELESIIQLCRDHQLRVVLLTMPMSQRFIWESEGLDTFRDIMCGIAGRYQVPYYDFNLLHDIDSWLDDSVSYHDAEHLSEAGAEAFGPVIGEILADCLHAENDQNLPGDAADLPDAAEYRFYETYEEARTHSVYQQP